MSKIHLQDKPSRLLPLCGTDETEMTLDLTLDLTLVTCQSCLDAVIAERREEKLKREQYLAQKVSLTIADKSYQISLGDLPKLVHELTNALD